MTAHGIPRGYDPRNYNPFDFTMREHRDVGAAMLQESTPQFLARCYSAHELADALTLKFESLASARRKLALNSVYGPLRQRFERTI